MTVSIVVNGFCGETYLQSKILGQNWHEHGLNNKMDDEIKEETWMDLKRMREEEKNEAVASGNWRWRPKTADSESE